MTSRQNIIAVAQLRPTQLAVGMLQVKQKRRRLRALEKRPAELVEFILEHPIRVVIGPKKRAYVIDHHHLALALMRERFETAPMEVEDDLSSLSLSAFWEKMRSRGFVYPYDAEGKERPLRTIPASLTALADDIYRSLAGFVREAGGYAKVPTPYAEFIWADFYRKHLKKKFLKKHFDKALDQAMQLARHKDARKLPGFIKANHT